MNAGSKVVLELAGHSGIITVRAGAGEPPHFCTEKGDTAPFELAMPGLVQRLDSGEGKALVKNMSHSLATGACCPWMTGLPLLHIKTSS